MNYGSWIGCLRTLAVIQIYFLKSPYCTIFNSGKLDPPSSSLLQPLELETPRIFQTPNFYTPYPTKNNLCAFPTYTERLLQHIPKPVTTKETLQKMCGQSTTQSGKGEGEKKGELP